MTAFIYVLIIFALVGAGASLANLQHARDPISPEPRGHRLRWGVQFAGFCAMVLGWSVAVRYGYTPFKLVWACFSVTICWGGYALGMAYINWHGRMRRLQARRRVPWHVFHPLLLLSLIGLIGGCGTSGMIRAAAVDPSFRAVADRHDKYVNADPTLTDLAKRTDLRDTALLRAILDAAKQAPTTQPAK